MSSMFGSGGQTVTAQPLMPAWQQQTGQNLSSWINQYLNNYVPGAQYSGALSAPLSSQEQTSLTQLSDFQNQPATGDLFAAGKSQIMDTLAGKYANPATSPYIQSTINLANQNLQTSIDQSRLGAGARGTYFTTPAMNQESTLRQNTQNQLQTVIGQFAQNERQNQLGAATTAQQMDQYGNLTAPLTQIAAGEQYGSLSRTVQQAALEAQYNAWLNQQKSAATPISAAENLYSTPAQYGIQSWTAPQTNSLTSLLSALGGGQGISSLGSSTGISSWLSSLFGAGGLASAAGGAAGLGLDTAAAGTFSGMGIEDLALLGLM